MIQQSLRDSYRVTLLNIFHPSVSWALVRVQRTAMFMNASGFRGLVKREGLEP